MPGRGGRGTPLPSVPRAASIPLRTWGAVPPRQFSYPLARVCLDPQFLCFESIELEMRKFLFLFALK